MEHTKTPWTFEISKADAGVFVYSSTGEEILIFHYRDKDIVKQIVRAVNAHEKLVEAVETLLSITKSLTANYETCDLPDEIDDALEFAEEALALAEK